jgi:hypothetical protein
VPRPIALVTVIDAAPEAVWRDLGDIGRHTEWMADAESITFAGEQHRGVGTTFDCVTKVGPFRTVDRMTVTRWVEGAELGVRHVGLVQGEGVFTLAPLDDGRRTRLAWTEDVRFPWHLGGRITTWLARPILRRIWRANLARLAALVTPSPGSGPA